MVGGIGMASQANRDPQEGPLIVVRTAMGRATVRLLKMNAAAQLAVRLALIDAVEW